MSLAGSMSFPIKSFIHLADMFLSRKKSSRFLADMHLDRATLNMAAEVMEYN